MAEAGGLIDWQARIGMTMVGLGAVGLFSVTRGWLDNGGGAIDYVLITMALFGILLLFLSMGIDVDNEELSQSTTLIPEEILQTESAAEKLEEE